MIELQSLGFYLRVFAVNYQKGGQPEGGGGREGEVSPGTFPEARLGGGCSKESIKDCRNRGVTLVFPKNVYVCRYATERWSALLPRDWPSKAYVCDQNQRGEKSFGDSCLIILPDGATRQLFQYSAGRMSLF